jgi:hypothetical protein
VFLLFSWGSGEGTHTSANLNTSLLGGGARPFIVLAGTNSQVTGADRGPARSPFPRSTDTSHWILLGSGNARTVSLDFAAISQEVFSVRNRVVSVGRHHRPRSKSQKRLRVSSLSIR